MPTRGRSSFVDRALQCFFSQTWPEKELVIADDADNPSFPDGFAKLGSDSPEGWTQYQYHLLPWRLSIGAKRNICCSRATGEVIWHLDDDDWSAPQRMADQVNKLIESGKPVTGYKTLEFRGEPQGRQHIVTERYLYTSDVPDYAPGSTLCYTRDWWLMHPFADRETGEDSQFASEAKGNMVTTDAGEMMWATIHPGNTSPRDLRTKNWSAL